MKGLEGEDGGGGGASVVDVDRGRVGVRDGEQCLSLTRLVHPGAGFGNKVELEHVNHVCANDRTA